MTAKTRLDEARARHLQPEAKAEMTQTQFQTLPRSEIEKLAQTLEPIAVSMATLAEDIREQIETSQSQLRTVQNTVKETTASLVEVVELLKRPWTIFLNICLATVTIIVIVSVLVLASSVLQKTVLKPEENNKITDLESQIKTSQKDAEEWRNFLKLTRENKETNKPFVIKVEGEKWAIIQIKETAPQKP